MLCRECSVSRAFSLNITRHELRPRYMPSRLRFYPSMHSRPPIHPSIHLSIHLSLHPSITSSIYSSMHPSTSIHTWILLANLFVSASILYLEVSYCMVHVCMCRFNLFICLSIHKTATIVIYLYTFGSPPTRIQVAEKQICTHMYIYVRMYIYIYTHACLQI